MARSVNREAKQPTHASLSAACPRTLRNVSCCPAKDAVGRSSAVADERTATSVFSPYCWHSRSYASAISAHRSSGIPAWCIRPRTFRPREARSATSFLSTPSNAFPISSLIPVAEIMCQ